MRLERALEPPLRLGRGRGNWREKDEKTEAGGSWHAGMVAGVGFPLHSPLVVARVPRQLPR